MANVNIFDKYGIKEVANVYFEALADDAKSGVYEGDVVLYLDTLKVSTLENAAEATESRGGWGNNRLIMWDYNKEITVTLEDALMSMESLRFMLGGAIKRASANDSIIVHHTAEVVAKSDGSLPLPVDEISGKKMTPKATDGHPIRLINLTSGARTQLLAAEEGEDPVVFSANGTKVKFVNPAMGITSPGVLPDSGDRVRIFWDEILTGANNETETAIEITISPSTFPGTYRVVGDTMIRSEKTGKDEAFQFVINKAKVASSVTLTLQAEGDPSTFEMTLNVLRAVNEDGQPEMMKLIRYSLEDSGSSSAGNDYGSIVE